MLPRLTVALLLLSLAAWGPVARASFDEICVQRWSLDGSDYNHCNNLPFLTPGNDTRVNLSLLLARSRGAGSPGGAAQNTDQRSGYPTSEDGYGSVPFMVHALTGGNLKSEEGAGGGKASGDASSNSWSAINAKLGLALPEGFPAGVDLPVNTIASGDGSRCQSNTPATVLAFITAMMSDDAVPANERKTLAKARLALLQTCAPTPEMISSLVPPDISSPNGRRFADYLTGAAAFYGGDFAQADARFTALESASQSWIAETARYMVARTALNNAQRNAFDEWGQRLTSGIDAGAIKTAETAFADYLAAYPAGRYAASAKGLLRKVYWLRADHAGLASAYADALAARPDARTLPGLIAEIDSKLVASLTTLADGRDLGIPTGRPPYGAERADLLAMLDLLSMRQAGDRPEDGSRVLNALRAQQPAFANRPDLYAYLIAAHAFYVARQPGEALKQLPPAQPAAAKGFDYVRFSSAMLRGLALEETGDRAGAASHWTALVNAVEDPLRRVAVELALAQNQARAGRVDELFAADSPIRQPEIRKVLLTRLAGPALLRSQAGAASVPAEEQTTAAFVLLYKDLMRGHYGDFARDFADFGSGGKSHSVQGLGAYGADADIGWFSAPLTDVEVDASLRYACPDLKAVAARLATNARDARGLNCLGEFVRHNELDEADIDQPYPPDELGGSPSQFEGVVFSRLGAYRTVINDPKALPDDKAYALYRALYCFASSGNNHCGGQDVSPEQRKAWFRTLKTRYAATPWAKDLKIYW